jgi:hypothetical protein
MATKAPPESRTVVIDADKIDELRARSGELFDGSEYDLPVPRMDGEKADTIKIKTGGGIEVEVTNEEWLKFIDGLKLGQSVTLTVEALVAGKGMATKEDDAGELTTTYTVALKTHTIYRKGVE